MALPPILSRERLYTKRGESIKLLDWCVVNTELGAMMEPVSFTHVDMTGKLVDYDLLDNQIDRLTFVNEDEMATKLFTAGNLVPVKAPLYS